VLGGGGTIGVVAVVILALRVTVAVVGRTG
jgi:hypothetical protein